MVRLKTGAIKKLNKARARVEKVILMETRRSTVQQRKWKAKISRSKSLAQSKSSAE